MTERSDQPESVPAPQPLSTASPEDLDAEAGLHADSGFDAEAAPDAEADEQDDAAEIIASEDLGQNAHEVVTALLGHQQDLVVELRGVYERLEQVREIDYVRLEERLAAAESAAYPREQTTRRLDQLSEQVQNLSAATETQAERIAELRGSDQQAHEGLTAQLAERDARISAQNARIAELESAVHAAAESADSAHEKLQVLAEETQSSLINRVSERLSPAAQQAKRALGNIARRLRR